MKNSKEKQELKTNKRLIGKPLIRALKLLFLCEEYLRINHFDVICLGNILSNQDELEERIKFMTSLN